MCCLREVDDPRRPSNRTPHDFLQLLVIAMAAVHADFDTIEDISYWERRKEKWLREFLVLKNRVRSAETFLRVFRALDPKQFAVTFHRWEAGVVGAFATEPDIVLGQEQIARKRNEITAIQELLKARSCLRN